MPLDNHRIGVDQAGWPPNTDSPHLNSETMAAYADDELTPAERNIVYHHLASCEQCADALTDLMTCLAETRPTRPWVTLPVRSRGKVIFGAGVAATAAVIVAIAILETGWPPRWFGRPAPEPELAELLAAFANEPTRAAEGRLSAPFQYGSAPAATRGGAREQSPDLRIAASRIEAAAQAKQTAVALHAYGLSRLVLGDVDAAITSLEQASAAAPSDAAIGNDLAVAYLERARLRSREDDRLKALTVVTRALAVAPDLLPALFNRALALDSLGKGGEAREAWRAFLNRERDAQWRAEASRRMAASQN